MYDFSSLLLLYFCIKMNGRKNAWIYRSLEIRLKLVDFQRRSVPLRLFSSAWTGCVSLRTGTYYVQEIYCSIYSIYSVSTVSNTSVYLILHALRWQLSTMPAVHSSRLACLRAAWNVLGHSAVRTCPRVGRRLGTQANDLTEYPQTELLQAVYEYGCTCNNSSTQYTRSTSYLDRILVRTTRTPYPRSSIARTLHLTHYKQPMLCRCSASSSAES